MKVISCLASKGGTGKSSTALLLAWELTKNHKSQVVILDADVQGTCISAKILNPSLPFDVVSVGNKTQLWEKGKQLSERGCEYLIIDGNPRSIHEDPALVKMIAQLSDLNLIISRPSPRDLKAQIKFVETIQSFTSGEIRILWNFFQKNTGAHRDGIPEGEKLLGLKSLKTPIALRIVYQDIGYSESHISDMGNKEATAEIMALCNEIKRVLHVKKK
jgi:cellulose biosynthesis protein BcsQ